MQPAFQQPTLARVTMLAGARIGQEANSQVTAPQFVDRAAGDFHLQPGSPALTASSTGGPVGCYVSAGDTVGLD